MEIDRDSVNFCQAAKPAVSQAEGVYERDKHDENLPFLLILRLPSYLDYGPLAL